MSSNAGSILIIAAPSGAGKTTLVRALLQARPHIRHSVSFTTRSPRVGEKHGEDYFFTDEPDFMARRDAGEFLEWAEVHGNFYATSRLWIDEQIAAGTDIVLEIDWQGVAQVQAFYPRGRLHLRRSAFAGSAAAAPADPGQGQRRHHRAPSGGSPQRTGACCTVSIYHCQSRL